MLLSVHIPKTGGVSFRNILKVYYAAGYAQCYWEITDAWGRVQAEVPFAELGGISAPTGPGGRTASSPPPLDGSDVARRVRLASQFAERDPHRAITHNKGIMNGVDAVVVATGNDWRAVEAAAHAFAARSGTYRPLATWREDNVRRVLVGELVLPLAVGIVGGALRAHRCAGRHLAGGQIRPRVRLLQRGHDRRERRARDELIRFRLDAPGQGLI